MSEKRIILCSQLIEQANSFDSKGEHETADQLTKVAKQLSYNEISVREALNFGKILGNGMFGLAGSALAPMFARQKGGMEYALNVLKTKNPTAYNNLFTKFQAIKQVDITQQQSKINLANEIKAAFQTNQPVPAPVATPAPVVTPAPAAAPVKQ